MMNRLLGIISVLVVIAHNGIAAESRTWTSKTGKTVEGKYVSIAFDNLNVEDAEGKLIKIPMAQLSDEDKNYIELINPPKLSVEYSKDVQAWQSVADDWISNFGGSTRNHPIFVINARFGARIKKLSSNPYNHKLTVEVFALTKQCYDPDNFHLIARSKSEPFMLNKENGEEFEYIDPKTYLIIYYNLYSTLPRGERPSDYMVLVWDERGEVIAHRSTGNWLYNNREKLMALPVGAWVNDKCDRIHPTSPKRGT